MKPRLSHERTIVPGGSIRQGVEGEYRILTDGPGEDRLVRTELTRRRRVPGRRYPLLSFVQLTDLHAVDACSPGRYEFAERFQHIPELRALLPAYRPQEMLQLYAIDAMVRAVNSLCAGPATGQPLDGVLLTGDLIDNGQENELRWLMALLAGACIDPGTYDGVATVEWDDDLYWHPDYYPDLYKSRYGFPDYPGLLETVSRPWQSEGSKQRWYGAFGNHDALPLGTAVANPAYGEILVGNRKAAMFPPNYEFEFSGFLEEFIVHPEKFLCGPSRIIAAAPLRRPLDRRAWQQLLAQSPGEPSGHGLSLDATRSYYVDDSYSGVRLVVLDTTNLCGHFQGCLAAEQMRWLEERMEEVHSRFWDERGREVRSGATDRLVVIVSHHEIATLNNLRVCLPHDEPRAGTAEVEALIHRFPNVVLWLNGHTHRNRIRPHTHPACETRGFWEVTTSSLIDWPCQGRVIEVAVNDDGTLSILTTMLDHGAPLDPREAEDIDRLAAIHRELAANDPHAGRFSGNAGEREDRTTELIVDCPAWLS